MVVAARGPSLRLHCVRDIELTSSSSTVSFFPIMSRTSSMMLNRSSVRCWRRDLCSSSELSDDAEKGRRPRNDRGAVGNSGEARPAELLPSGSVRRSRYNDGRNEAFIIDDDDLSLLLRPACSSRLLLDSSDEDEDLERISCCCSDEVEEEAIRQEELDVFMMLLLVGCCDRDMMRLRWRFFATIEFL
eukprot:CAMPEP_0119568608 /NCGR_PEP_ID=MMETSP1352-20130426/39379_1 /TAXON_ID=265584 /ORGANISM="Stauroneis constricta, Strain CCMP1120" /LENGTH=187 /DNA_ID=CAMNT_0007618045 /DNA_START=59 /DNA_END=622 /DNA_ORIENTATION=-